MSKDGGFSIVKCKKPKKVIVKKKKKSSINETTKWDGLLDIHFAESIKAS